MDHQEGPGGKIHLKTTCLTKGAHLNQWKKGDSLLGRMSFGQFGDQYARLFGIPGGWFSQYCHALCNGIDRQILFFSPSRFWWMPHQSWNLTPRVPTGGVFSGAPLFVWLKRETNRKPRVLVQNAPPSASSCTDSVRHLEAAEIRQDLASIQLQLGGLEGDRSPYGPLLWPRPRLGDPPQMLGFHVASLRNHRKGVPSKTRTGGPNVIITCGERRG